MRLHPGTLGLGRRRDRWAAVWRGRGDGRPRRAVAGRIALAMRAPGRGDLALPAVGALAGSRGHLLVQIRRSGAKSLADLAEVVAVEGSFASVIGGAPASPFDSVIPFRAACAAKEAATSSAIGKSPGWCPRSA